jgi:two-component system, OmpR family, response regulator MtrA
MPASILYADDDREIRKLVETILHNAGMSVACASNGYDALELWRSQYVDLVLLDVMMPGMTGFELTRTLRRISNVPIILLTSKGREGDVVEGLAAGADDYIIKPFRPKELVARIQAVLERAKRSNAPEENSLQYKDLTIDDLSKQVKLAGEEKAISPTEYRLLQYLVRRQGQVCSKAELLQNVWGYVDSTGPLNLIEAAIARLRRKIEPDPENPIYIHTVRGTGYRLGDRD